MKKVKLPTNTSHGNIIDRLRIPWRHSMDVLAGQLDYAPHIKYRVTQGNLAAIRIAPHFSQAMFWLTFTGRSRPYMINLYYGKP